MKNIQSNQLSGKIENAGYFQSGQTLSPNEIRNILQTSHAELANLSLEKQQIYQHIRSLASICGGWSEIKVHRQNSKPTLREYCIV